MNWKERENFYHKSGIEINKINDLDNFEDIDGVISLIDICDFVLTISNPCGKDDFPMEVNKNYFCNGKKLDDKQVYVLDDRLVIGLFHNASKCNEQSIAAIDKHQITGQYCAFRNNAPLEEVKGGMGDIFIRLAKDN